MTFADQLLETISEKHLLKHPFYQAWTEGRLSQKTLQEYTRQYLAHVDAFPRFVSAIHSMCENIEDRQMLLENLNDEEQGADNHPELWRRFGEGLGLDRSAYDNVDMNPESQALVDQFWARCRSSYAEGLAALFAYEYQTPEISKVKIEGLKEFYNIDDERTLAFFDVHREADVYHSDACKKQLNALSADDQAKALEAAVESSDALWNFLSGLYKHVPQEEKCACDQKASDQTIH